jgi:hypothetical protein
MLTIKFRCVQPADSTVQGDRKTCAELLIVDKFFASGTPVLLYCDMQPVVHETSWRNPKSEILSTFIKN